MVEKKSLQNRACVAKILINVQRNIIFTLTTGRLVKLILHDFDQIQSSSQMVQEAK